MCAAGRIALSAGVTLVVLLGCLWYSPAVPAAPLLKELVGVVQVKLRAEKAGGTSDPPGRAAGRSDLATMLLVDGSQMYVLEGTRVIDGNGRETDFNELPVPCTARIVYQQLTNGSRNIHEVHVVAVSAGASKRWGEPAPH